MAGIDPSRLTPRAFAALFAALFVLAALPVLRSAIPPLVDYPNHLARMAILAHLAQDATLQQFYVLAWRPVPNLAMDALVPPLLAVLPLEAAGRVFVLLTFLLLAGGVALVHRALYGRWSAWSLLVFLVLYNRLLLWGILNYLFGLGLAFCALAAMLALRERPAWRAAAGVVIALLLYFAHLMALGVYAVLLLGVEATTLRRAPLATLRRLAIAGAPFVLPLAILLAGGGGEGGPVAFTPLSRKPDLLFSVFDLYHRPFDVACFALAVAGIGVALWRRWLALAPALMLPLVLLAILYVVIPTQMMGASGIDRRLPLALALLICSGIAWIAPRPGLERAFLAVAAVLFLARLATVGASWEASDREYRPLLASLDSLPSGSRLAVAAPPEATNVQATPLVHLPVLAAAQRDAFVPTLFAFRGQQPVAFTPTYAALAQATSPDHLWHGFVDGPPLGPAGRALLARYDYIVFTGVRPFALADLAGLVPVFLAPRFQLFRVAR
jgi:hypothetical protein